MKEIFDKKFKKYIIIFFLIFLMVGSNSFAWEKLDYVTYSGYTGEEVTIGWTNPCTDLNTCTIPDEYEYEFYNKDMNVTLIKGTTSDTQVTVTLTRTGHYIPKVRSKKNECVHEDPNDLNSPMIACYSEWAESIDPQYAIVDDESRSWWIFTWVSPPGDVVIGNKIK
jgi:hypothetical protein